MLEKIDTEKTIALNKIYFINGRVFDMFILILMYGMFVITLPIIAISYEINHFDTISTDTLASIFSTLIPIAISGVMFLYLSTRKNLQRFSNIDKEVIISAVEELNWRFVSSNQKYMIIEAGTWQRQISIIFDNSDILIHSLRFGQYNFYLRETSRLDLLLDKIKKIKNHDLK